MNKGQQQIANTKPIDSNSLVSIWVMFLYFRCQFRGPCICCCDVLCFWCCISVYWCFCVFGLASCQLWLFAQQWQCSHSFGLISLSLLPSPSSSFSHCTSCSELIKFLLPHKIKPNQVTQLAKSIGYNAGGGK